MGVRDVKQGFQYEQEIKVEALYTLVHTHALVLSEDLHIHLLTRTRTTAGICLTQTLTST